MIKYNAIVHPIGMTEDWIISDIDGDTDEDRALYLLGYMLGVGVSHFSILHYAPSVIDIDDDIINLN